jgi:hypothetical protein
MNKKILLIATVCAMVHGAALIANADTWPPPHIADLPPDYLQAVSNATYDASYVIDTNAVQVETVMKLIKVMAHGGYESEASAFIEAPSFVFSTFPENGFRLFSTADFRIYGLYNPRTGLARKCLTLNASAKLESEMWRGIQEAEFGWRLTDVTQKDLWAALGSENSEVCSAVGYLLAARYLKDIPEYASLLYRDGSTAGQQYTARVERMKRWIDARVQKGTLFEEYCAQYTKWTIPALLNLHDFCGDPVLQKKIGMFLDLALAEMAEDTLNGQRGSPKHRNKKDTSSTGAYIRFR